MKRKSYLTLAILLITGAALIAVEAFGETGTTWDTVDRAAIEASDLIAKQQMAKLVVQCPPPIPPEKRVRIVPCTDDTYAVQYLTVDGKWMSYATASCGKTLGNAREFKAMAIASNKAANKANRPQPKQPIVEVE